MWVKSLQLKQYRNYEAESLTFSPSKNIILGMNGQGKTNLLEALYFLSHGRSHRTSLDRQLVQANQPFALLRATLVSHQFESQTHLEIQFQRDVADRMKTKFVVDHNPLKKKAELMGVLPTVSFFNTDLLLLRGAPSHRRQWLDDAITQYYPPHFTDLAEFNRIKTQKTKLLKTITYPDQEVDNLMVWNQQFAKVSARLMVSRLSYLKTIGVPLLGQHQQLCPESVDLAVFYEANGFGVWGAADWDKMAVETALEEALLAQMEQQKSQEIQRQVCLVGPHRDDILFTLNELDTSVYGSQGQQRTLILALKLVELQVLSEKVREPLVLLLDDVMAELDPNRQQFLLDAFDPKSQVFLTTTHLDHRLDPFLKGEGLVQQFTVEGGRVIWPVAMPRAGVVSEMSEVQSYEAV